jgi:hypothetical protein
MNTINTYSEFVVKFPWLIEALSLSPMEALWMAYRTGRLDGGLAVLDRQSTAQAIESWADDEVRGNA